MNHTNTAETDRVCTALQWDPADPSIQIESLVTLPHSYVARVHRSGDTPMLFKQAGSPDFAAGVRKELVVNRDVLDRFASPVGPAYITGEEQTEMPWILFQDLSTSHAVSPYLPPPQSQIRQFIVSLARTHAQGRALPLDTLFENVEGDVRITDGAEQVPAVLDEFLQAVDEDRFPRRSYELVRKLRDNIPTVAQLVSDVETLVHGDAHFGNALYDQKGALLIDWALAVIGPGEVDLAHALALNLPRLYSSEYEDELLRVYAETCSLHGHDVSERNVRDRYRHCMLMSVIVAVGMRTVPGMSDRVWSFMFTNVVHAALDHDLLALID